MLTDTHAHLYWDLFKKDFDQVIKRAVDAGVTTIINVGVDIEKSKEALKQVQETAWPSGMSVYSTIGIHPHESAVFSSDQIDQLEQVYKSNSEKVAGVGECGLDWVEVTEQEKKLQYQLFQAQINLAKKLNLPLIVHCRDDRSQNPQNSAAWDEVLRMVKNHPTILHCYSGLIKTTQEVLKMPNALVSFAGNLTYPKNEYLRDAVKILPLNRIILETDCPFLPPQSKRGQRNEPANILEIARLIADLKGATLEKISIQTTKNVKIMFNL